MSSESAQVCVRARKMRGTSACICSMEARTEARGSDANIGISNDRYIHCLKPVPISTIWANDPRPRLSVSINITGLYSGLVSKIFQKNGFPKTQAGRHDGSLLAVRTRDSNQGRPNEIMDARARASESGPGRDPLRC